MAFIRRKSYIKRKRKATGERDLFLEIWNEREHICSNKKCQKHLGEDPLAYYFAHIKPKGVYPELRLEKTNIQLLCWACHQAFDFGDRSSVHLQ
jgi:5-methylcytosine-specific restriction endonuclease McrA